MVHPVSSDRNLRRRVRYFFQARPVLSVLVEQLEVVAPVAVFGGLVRDASVLGMRAFSSDVDLVVECADATPILEIIGAYPHTMNRFGGYRLDVGGWSVDLWPLGATWAIRQGFVTGSTLDVLPATTFFSCDAVAFDLTRRTLYASESYRRWISERLVEVNLVSNPNHLGATVRALRFVATVPGVRVGPGLGRFLVEALQEIDASRVCALEASSYSRPVLHSEYVGAFVRELRSHSLRQSSGPFTFDLSADGLQLKWPMALPRSR